MRSRRKWSTPARETLPLWRFKYNDSHEFSGLEKGRAVSARTVQALEVVRDDLTILHERLGAQIGALDGTYRHQPSVQPRSMQGNQVLTSIIGALRVLPLLSDPAGIGGRGPVEPGELRLERGAGLGRERDFRAVMRDSLGAQHDTFSASFFVVNPACCRGSTLR